MSADPRSLALQAELEAEGRCYSTHYMTGWACQREAGHDGVHVANAGPDGELLKLGDKYGVYAWSHARGRSMCEQDAATDDELAAFRAFSREAVQ